MAWHFQNRTLDLNPLTDAYIEFCLGHSKEILREYKLKGGATLWGYANHCLQAFIRDGQTVTRYRFDRIERAYLKDASAYLADNAHTLWEAYQKDPAYRAAIARSWDWVNWLRNKYNHPPRNYFGLDLAFGAAECFMMLEEKKLL